MKAILILDMPKSCIKCKLGLMYGSFCAINGDTYVTEGNKSEECPLKPLPQRKEELYYPRSEYEIAVNEGYNKCIDEILEGE